jgi:hypothetical protein
LYASHTEASTPAPESDGTDKGILTIGDESAGDWTETLGAATIVGDITGELPGADGAVTAADGAVTTGAEGAVTAVDGAVTAGPLSSSSQNGMPSADTFGGIFFDPAGPFFPRLTFDTVTTKVVLGVLFVVTDGAVVFVLVVLVDDVLFPKTFEFVELLCKDLYTSVLFDISDPAVALVVVLLVVDVDAVVLLVVFVVTAVSVVSVLTLLPDAPPFPPLPMPFPTPTPTPSPVTPAPSFVFFSFLGFLHVVLIFTFVSTDEASDHCRYKERKMLRKREGPKSVSKCLQ